MKRPSIRLAVSSLGASLLAASFSTPQPVAAQTARRPAPAYVPGELLVKFSGSATGQSIFMANRRVGARATERLSDNGWQRISLRPGMSMAAAAASYRARRDVAAVEPNYIWQPLKTPNEPAFAQQYALSRISAPAAWDASVGSANVVVAVIDTGIDYNHEDLRDNMWRNPGEVAGNGVDDDGNGFVDDVYGIDALNNDSDPLDDDDHGTHIAGIIGAAGNNGKGIAGVNWSVHIMALKFSGVDGGSTADAIRCFNYVTMMKQRGINIRATSNSWGGSGFSQALKDAMDAASNAGIINVCAAGNAGTSEDLAPSYPGSFDSPGIISVTASNEADNPAPFSNYGARNVDIAAPGVSILSTVRGESLYAFFSGSSMAAPHVAGAAALLASVNGALSVADLKNILLRSADVLPQWTGKVASNGRLNLARALAGDLSALPVSPPVEVPPAAAPVTAPPKKGKKPRKPRVPKKPRNAYAFQLREQQSSAV